MSSGIIAVSLAVAILAAAQPSIAQESSEKPAVADEGQLAFNNACRTCHTLREGDNRLGPTLHGIVGRKAGSLPNFVYSSALKGAGLVWDKATLDRFIANPDQVVSGHKMQPYGGIASADDRAKIIAFLETRSRN